MPKPKQQMHCLSICGLSLKSKETTRRGRMLTVHRRRKRKVGVTLGRAVKKNRSHVNVLLSETVTDTSLKQKLNAVVHKSHEYSHSDMSSGTYQGADGQKPVTAVCLNDTTDSPVDIASSPVIIDDSTDTERSSLADATTVYNTSAFYEDISDSTEDQGRITRGTG